MILSAPDVNTKISQFSPDKIGPPPISFSKFAGRRSGLQKITQKSELIQNFRYPAFDVCAVQPNSPRTVMCHAPSILMIFTR